MDNRLIKQYEQEYAEKYFGNDIFVEYPETKIIPQYILKHFSDAQYVLDLGFGTGLWFWASFLFSLKRLDGIDFYKESLYEADKVFKYKTVPEGYLMAHAKTGHKFTSNDIAKLKDKRGTFFFRDYCKEWPSAVNRRNYDLITEHGGGFGQMRSEKDIITTVKKCANVLRPGGSMLFVNFVIEPSEVEKQLGRVSSATLDLKEDIFRKAVKHAGMNMLDFHEIDHPQAMGNITRFLYGYAQK